MSTSELLAGRIDAVLRWAEHNVVFAVDSGNQMRLMLRLNMLQVADERFEVFPAL